MELIRKEKPINIALIRTGWRLIAATVTLSFCLISPVWALGVGQLKTESALNQPLSAKIEILGIEGNELESLEVRLADSAVFERMGIERHDVLDRLKFSVERPRSGEPYIRVTSVGAISEPFVNFLIEINWAAGRLLREYTVLLDPTVTTEEKAVATEAPETGAPPEVVIPSASPELVDVPSTPRVSEAPQLEQSESETQKPIKFGPVKRGQNLWRIAAAIKPSNVTVEQAMLVLYQQNPEAFFGNNISMLKAGAVLRVKDPNDFMNVSIDKAIAEVAKQHQEWLAYRREKMADRAVAAESATQRPIGTREAPEHDGLRAGESRLELVTPGPEEVNKSRVGNVAAESATQKALDQLRVDLSMSNEALEAATKENVELTSRVGKLETQLQSMQSLLELKERQLAAVQGEQGGETAVESVAKIDMLEDGEPEEADSQETPKKELEPANLLRDPVTIGTIVGAIALLGLLAWVMRKRKRSAKEKLAVPSAFSPAVLDEFDEQENKPLTAQVNLEQNEATEQAVDVAPLEIPLDKRLGSEPRPTSTPSEIELLEPIEMPIESEIGHIDEDKPLAASKPELGDELDAVLSEVATSKPISSAPVSRREDSGIDVIAEADVYIAYGKYAKAEEVIRSSIEQDPDRHELKLKLLEVFVLDGRRDAFIEKAEELYAALKGDKQHPIWRSVVELARDFNVDNPLFESSHIAKPQSESRFSLDTFDLIDETPINETPISKPSMSDLTLSDIDKVKSEIDFPSQSASLSEPAISKVSVSRPSKFAGSVSQVEPAAFEGEEDVAQQDWQPDQVTAMVSDRAPLMPDTEFEPKDLPGFSVMLDELAREEKEPSIIVDTAGDLDIAVPSQILARDSEIADAEKLRQAEQDDIAALAETFAEEESPPPEPVDHVFTASQPALSDVFVDEVLEEPISQVGVSKAASEAAKLDEEINPFTASKVSVSRPVEPPLEPLPFEADETFSQFTKSQPSAILSKPVSQPAEGVASQFAKSEPTSVRFVPSQPAPVVEQPAVKSESVQPETATKSKDADMSKPVKSQPAVVGDDEIIEPIDDITLLDMDAPAAPISKPATLAEELLAASRPPSSKPTGQPIFGKSTPAAESSFFLLDDEVDTKLDLARAYIEMGDKDGAIDLLKEVQEEGDERQKQDAKELLALTQKKVAI